MTRNEKRRDLIVAYTLRDQPPPLHNRAYRAEWRAERGYHAEPLDGTQRTAQAYVDRITRSAWWRRTCHAHRIGDTTGGNAKIQPTRILVIASRGGGSSASYGRMRYRGKYLPHLRLGTTSDTYNGHPGIADQWTILHEVAHILACCHGGENGHGPVFAAYYYALVQRWLGPDAALALRTAFKVERVKYRGVLTAPNSGDT